MECMRSFFFRVDVNSNFTSVLKQWTTSLGNHYWTINAGAASDYNFQGFKKISIYGIDLIGNVSTLQGASTGGVIVNDWAIDVLISGQAPLVGGNVSPSPNFYSINPTDPFNRNFPLSKYSNSIKFSDPITSVSFLRLGTTYASGIGYQTLNDINLRWNLNFIVHYKFEGE